MLYAGASQATIAPATSRRASAKRCVGSIGIPAAMRAAGTEWIDTPTGFDVRALNAHAIDGPGGLP